MTHASPDQPARILIVDDDPFTLDLLEQQLAGQGYVVDRAAGGEEALKKVEASLPDVILLDLMMPGIDGIEVLRRLRQDERHRAIPVILVTALGAREDKVKGLEAGADDYVVKPFDEAELLARVRSMLRIKRMQDSLEQWGRTLENKVRQQVDEIQRLARLKRFLSPQIADALLRDTGELFRPHRREVSVVYLWLDGFVAAAETAEPEELVDVLRAFLAAMGELAFAYNGTIGFLTGATMKVVLNDPVEVPDHPEQAVRMVIEMRDRVNRMREDWQRAGMDMNLVVGLATGYATLGEIGFEGRSEYIAVGRANYLATSLSRLATGGQILTDKKSMQRIERLAKVEPLGEKLPPGFSRPVEVFNIIGLREAQAKSPTDPLSPREREVAALVARGLSSKEIAASLLMGERTAESHIQSIFNKLGFRSRTQIAAWATERGLTPPPGT